MSVPKVRYVVIPGESAAFGFKTIHAAQRKFPNYPVFKLGRFKQGLLHVQPSASRGRRVIKSIYAPVASAPMGIYASKRIKMTVKRK